MSSYHITNRRQCDTPIVFDTGCSCSVTPFRDDFVTKIQKSKVKEMTALVETTKIKGQGWVEWPIRDIFGQIGLIKTQAYYVPHATIRLHSPQTYFQENRAGRCEFDHCQVTLHTPNGMKLQFPYQNGSNIPMMLVDHEVPQAGLTASQVYCLGHDKELDDHIESLIIGANYCQRGNIG